MTAPEVHTVQTRESHNHPWTPYAERLTEDEALRAARVGKVTYPRRQFRVIDGETAQITHIGADGNPLPVEVMVRDRRTPEQVMADLAADRYEVALERGRDL